MVFGLVAAIVLARGSLIKALAMVCLGLLLGMIGTDVNSGVIRFAFGQPELADGSLRRHRDGVLRHGRRGDEPGAAGAGRRLHVAHRQRAADAGRSQDELLVDRA